MDLTQAKLILASFRPNGSDHNDPAFTEALELAAEDKTLGQWLASERAQDLEFAESLADLPIPENLRENLFEALAFAQSGPGYDEFDNDFANALSELEPPANLRGDILAAMEVEQKITNLPTQHKKSSPRWFNTRAIGIAAAASVAAALVWTTFLKPESAQRTVVDMTPANVEIEAINFLSGNIDLDRQDPKQEALYQFLASQELPSPEKLPQGLQDSIGVGCKRLDFNDKPASLICYKSAEDVVHLIVLRRDAIDGDLPEIAEAKRTCTQCERPGWSVASWRDEDKAFFLLGKMEPEQLAAIF